MTYQIQKSPNRAETGYSNIIHVDTANNSHINMILNNRQCLAFCCDVLERYEYLLQRFAPDNPRAYSDNEVDVFLALSNIEKSLRTEA